MSEIKVDSLTGKTSAGNITVTSEGGAATMQLQQGLAKAWVNFNGQGTIAIRENHGISSLIDNGQGDYTINFVNAFSAATYTISGSASGNNQPNRGYVGLLGADNSNAPATSSLRIKFGLGSTGSVDGQLFDSEYSMAIMHGGLA